MAIKPRTRADLKFHHPDALLLEQVMYDRIPATAVRIIGGSRQKTMRPLLLRLPAVQILEPQIAPLQQNGSLHLVGIHQLQHPLWGDLVGPPGRRDQCTDRSIRINALSAAAAAQLAPGTRTCNALHQMDMRINDLHVPELLFVSNRFRLFCPALYRSENRSAW